VAELQRVGARYSAAQFIVRQAQLLFEQGAIDQAQTLLAEGIQLAQEFDRPQSVFDGRLLQAKIAFARGDREAAVQQLQALRAVAVEEAQQAALHYELAKMGQGQDHIRLALTHYEQFCVRTPNIVYQERLAELRALTSAL